MERQHQLKFCKVCNNKGFDMKRGIICSITDDYPKFENSCENYQFNSEYAEKEKEKENRLTSEKGNITDYIDKKGVYKNKVRPAIGIIVIIIFGIAMIYNPDLMQGAEPTGRKVLLKSLIKFIWGIPTGIIFLGGGIFLAYKYMKKHKIIA